MKDMKDIADYLLLRVEGTQNSSINVNQTDENKVVIPPEKKSSVEFVKKITQPDTVGNDTGPPGPSMDVHIQSHNHVDCDNDAVLCSQCIPRMERIDEIISNLILRLSRLEASKDWKVKTIVMEKYHFLGEKRKLQHG